MEIKERVELKISEEMDASAFAILANETLSELNEVAYLEAPVKKYSSEEIYKTNPVMRQIFDYATKGKDLLINLPFNYKVGANELTVLVWDEDRIEQIPFKFAEFGQVHLDSDKLILKQLTTEKGKVLVEVELDMFKGKQYDKEVIVKLPDDFSTMIRVEIRSNTNTIAAKEVSVNSFNENLITTDTYYAHIYYIVGNMLHIISPESIEAINLHYTRRMTKVDKETDLNLQYVEIEPNFENLIVVSIAHKWFENFVGTNNSETNNMFEKYQILKEEYESKSLPKKLKRRQKSIDTIV